MDSALTIGLAVCATTIMLVASAYARMLDADEQKAKALGQRLLRPRVWALLTMVFGGGRRDGRADDRDGSSVHGHARS